MLVLEVNFPNADALGWSPYSVLQRLRNDFGCAFIRIASRWGEASFARSVEEYVHSDKVFAYVPRVRDERDGRATVKRSRA